MADQGLGVRSSIWARFRRTRAFLPTVVAVPALVIAGTGAGIYAGWDSTRVDIPSVVGERVPNAVGALQDLRLPVAVPPRPDATLSSDCYVVTTQSLAAGTRVVPEENRVTLDIEPALQQTPDVIGLSFAEATEELLGACLHATTTGQWCLPKGFSGSTEALVNASFKKETGFVFEPGTRRLGHPSLVPDETWRVCEQSTRQSGELAAGSELALSLTVPLTVVPEAPSPTVAAVLDALAHTADGCALQPRLVPTFAANPAALGSVSLPSKTLMAGWDVISVSPATGHAVLCDETVRVEVAWPGTTVPQLVGLHHVPEGSNAATPTTAALEAAGLKTTCSGKGTVTSQVPEPGSPAPLGTAITCVAELVMPHIVGLDPDTAAAVLTAAGVKGNVSGSGIVVSQTPEAGAVLSTSQSASYRAEAPRQVIPDSGGGGAFYENCSAARAAGAAPLYRGDPGYRSKLDRDNDGIACE